MLKRKRDEEKLAHLDKRRVRLSSAATTLWLLFKLLRPAVRPSSTDPQLTRIRLTLSSVSVATILYNSLGQPTIHRQTDRQL